jgi:hypothetical protein
MAEGYVATIGGTYHQGCSLRKTRRELRRGACSPQPPRYSSGEYFVSEYDRSPSHMLKTDAIKTAYVYPLKSRNYKASATVGVTTVVATPVRAILDTGAGPNLVCEEILPEDWERYRVTNDPPLNIVGAGGRWLRQKGVLTLCVQLGRLRVKASFVVVPRLAAECILRCQFIDQHVRNILPKERRVTLSGDRVLPTLHNPQPLQSHSVSEDTKIPPSTKLRIAKLVTVPPRAEGTVSV